MPKISLPILLSRSLDEGALPSMVGARLVNGYVDKLGPIPFLRKFFGMELLIDLSVTSRIDGLFWWDEQGIAVFVCNGRIYKITSQDGNYTDITGDALATVGPTSFCTNGTYGFFASGGRMVTSNAGADTAFVADADAPTTVSHVAYFDRYILALKTDSRYFYWSDVNAPLNWTATSFANPESKPDDILNMKVEDREITLFGKESTEVWYNDGVNPFSRLEGAFINRGWLAANSIVYGGGSFYGLDNERRICSITGRTPKILSSEYDEYIREINPVSDAIGQFISIGKQAFYILTWPTKNYTLAYNVVTETFSELGDWDSENALYTAWKGISYCYARDWDLHLVGDKTSGKIYKLTPGAFQNNGETIRTIMRTGQTDSGTTAPKITGELRVKCKRGAGGLSGNEPIFTLKYRDQMGPWSNEMQASLGKMGEYENIVRFHRLGMYRSRQYEMLHTDNSDFQVFDMEEN